MAVQYQEWIGLGATTPPLFVLAYYTWVEGEAERVAALVNQPPRPPMVTVALPDQRVPAALLIWARPADGGGWRAGLCYIHKTWHSRALVTTWAPAVRVSPHPTATYDQVPRIRLQGDPSQWPPLPPRYPGASQRWLAEHQHLAYGSAP